MELTDLLLQAASCLAKLSSSTPLLTPEAALEEVRNFNAIENQIHEIPNAQTDLKKWILTPANVTNPTANHAMVAGLILARSGWASSTSALLNAARQNDSWCAAQSRFNLSWLIPNEENISTLQRELTLQAKLDSPEIPSIVLINALIHQRSEAVLSDILAYLQGEDEVTQRILAFTSLVTLMPEQGILVAKEIENEPEDLLFVTALGLRAVYGSKEAYSELLSTSAQGGKESAIALRWIGRVPRSESLMPLLEGLNHSSSLVRCDVATSLALIGTKDAREAVVGCLFDLSKEVSEQAASLIFEWLGDDLHDFFQNWQYDSEGQLTIGSRQELQKLAIEELGCMNSKLRYFGKNPMLLTDSLDNLYLGRLPDHNWYHWVSTTGAYKPYDIYKGILYNFPSLELLEDWVVDRSSEFIPGSFYYYGEILPV